MEGDTGQREAGDAAGQHAGSAEAVDQEAGHGLADPGNDEEDRGRRPDAGEAEAELRHQPGKECRQQEVEEMRDTVYEADQGDDFEILGGGWRRQGGGGHGRAGRRKGREFRPKQRISGCPSSKKVLLESGKSTAEGQRFTEKKTGKKRLPPASIFFALPWRLRALAVGVTGLTAPPAIRPGPAPAMPS